MRLTATVTSYVIELNAQVRDTTLSRENRAGPCHHDVCVRIQLPVVFVGADAFSVSIKTFESRFEDTRNLNYITSKTMSIGHGVACMVSSQAFSWYIYCNFI